MANWTQELSGKYVSDDGREIDVVWDYPSLSIQVTDNETIFEYFGSMEDLERYLNDKGLPPLHIVPRTDPTNWQRYNDFQPDKWTKKVWCKVTDTRNIGVLMLLAWEEDDYSLHLWDTGYQHELHFVTNFLGYVRSENKNPTSDLEVAVHVAMSRGASGMFKTWRNIKMSVINDILKNEFNITLTDK